VFEFADYLMATPPPARLIAIAECVVFTLIAGSTLVLAKKALAYLGPLTITSLRYALAFLLLLPFIYRHGARFSPQLWYRFALIGLSLYVVGNGALFWGLMYIPATTASLLLSLIPVLVLIAGTVWLNETPTRLQGGGVMVVVIGSLLFFSRGLQAAEPRGVAIVAISLFANAAFGILSRGIAKEQKVDTLTRTAVPLAIAAAILVPIAWTIEGLPRFSLMGWGLVLGLAVVNTAVAYVLYNHALSVLPAFELSAMLNLTPMVTALGAWWFLSEKLSLVQIAGMIAVVIGVWVVQWGKNNGVSAKRIAAKQLWRT
jgi:drug/metabolite transporter (DMT)-like permease